MIHFPGQLPNAPHKSAPWKLLVIVAVAFLAVSQIVDQFEKRT